MIGAPAWNRTTSCAFVAHCFIRSTTEAVIDWPTYKDSNLEPKFRRLV